MKQFSSFSLSTRIVNDLFGVQLIKWHCSLTSISFGKLIAGIKEFLHGTFWGRSVCGVAAHNAEPECLQVPFNCSTADVYRSPVTNGTDRRFAKWRNEKSLPKLKFPFDDNCEICYFFLITKGRNFLIESIEMKPYEC